MIVIHSCEKWIQIFDVIPLGCKWEGERWMSLKFFFSFFLFFKRLFEGKKNEKKMKNKKREKATKSHIIINLCLYPEQRVS